MSTPLPFKMYYVCAHRDETFKLDYQIAEFNENKDEFRFKIPLQIPHTESIIFIFSYKPTTGDTCVSIKVDGRSWLFIDIAVNNLTVINLPLPNDFKLLLGFTMYDRDK
jgi:hypothetical protein